MSDGPSQGEEMSRGLPTGGTPGCAGGTQCAPDRTNIYMTPAQLANVRALHVAAGGERIYMDLAQVQELLAGEAERDRLLEANLRACEILLWASLPCSVKKEPVSYVAVMSASGLLASGRLSTHPLPVTAAEIPGERLGWKRALEKIEDLAGEFGSTPAECLAIIGDYIGEALHGIAQGKVPEPVPIDMVLHCPKCGLQHVDAPEPSTGWTNPSHKSHLCAAADCKTVFRPADVPTNGVAAVQTRGKADTWPGPAAQDEEHREWTGRLAVSAAELRAARVGFGPPRIPLDEHGNFTPEEKAAIERFIEDQREHPNGMGCGNMATQHIPPPSPVPVPSGSVEERLAALEKHHHETSLAAAHDLAEALRERAAAYARGLERALEVFRSLMPLGEAGIEWAYWDRIEKSFAKEIGRALAGTGAQPPPDARVVLAELLRLYDWRFFLAERERDPRDKDAEFRKETQRLLRQYGTKKKAAWETARRALAGDAGAALGAGLPPGTWAATRGIELPAAPPGASHGHRLASVQPPVEEKKPAPATGLRMPVVIGEASDGWHVAVATYPASMDTACGKKMLPATQFETTDAARGHTFCIACLHAWPEPEAPTDTKGSTE